MEGMQQILGVIAVFGLLAATLWWLRRRGVAHVAGLPRRRKATLLHPVDRLPLSPTHTLHLVRVADRAILLAVSPSGCQVVESSTWAHLEGHFLGAPQ